MATDCKPTPCQPVLFRQEGACRVDSGVSMQAGRGVSGRRGCAGRAGGRRWGRRGCRAVALAGADRGAGRGDGRRSRSRSSALADFPYIGDGTAGDPSSWKLEPGHTPTNVGDPWKLAATPADPNDEKVPGEKLTIEQNNSQQDELCGVTGMSLVDSHATFPAGTGSCIAAGSPVKTAFEVTLGRPDVAIGELDSGIKWNNAGDMTQLRKKVLINAGELPAPKVDLSTTFDSSTGVELRIGARRHGRRLQRQRRHARRHAGRQRADPLRRARTGRLQHARLRLRLARRARRRKLSPQCTNPPTTRECRNGPSGDAHAGGSDHRLLRRHRPRQQRLRQRHRRLELRRQQQRPLRRRPVRPRHRRGRGLDRGSEQQRRRDRHVPQLQRAAAARGRVVRRRGQPLRPGDALRDRPRRRRRAGGARHLQRPRVRARSDRLRLQPRRRGDRLRRRRGGRAPQPAGRAAAHDRRQRGRRARRASAASRSPTSRPPTCSSTAARTSARASTSPCRPPRAPRRPRARAPASPGSSTAPRSTPAARRCTATARAAAGRNCSRQRLHARRWHAVRDHGRRGPPADGLRQHRGHAGQRLLAARLQRAELRAARRPTSAKAARPTTSTPPSSRKRRAAWGWRPAAPTPTSTRRSPPTRKAGVVGPLPDTFRYPSRKGFDEFFGYGRIDAYKSVEAAAQGWIPPEADITSPEWFEQLDPAQRLDRGQRLRERPHELHLPRGGRAGRPAEQRLERLERRLRRRSLVLLQRRDRARESVQRAARERQHGDAAGDVPAGQTGLVHRQRERRHRRRPPTGARTRCPTRSPSASS